MNKKYNTQNWVGNMYQRFEAVCHEVDEFVHKDTVKYVENHMQTVGESVKKFYSGVVQDMLPPLVDPVQQHVAQLIPLKRIDLVETHTNSVVGIKESTVDSNTNKSENRTLVPTEKCNEPSSSTGLCHSEQISCAVSGSPICEADANSSFQQEDDNKINKTSDKAVIIHLNESTSSQEDSMVDESTCTDVSSSKHHKDSSEPIIQIKCIDEKCDDDDDDDDDYHSAKISRQSSENHLDKSSFEEEGILCNASSKIDASVFEDADWGIENILDLNLEIGEKIDGELSPFLSEDVNNAADIILLPFVEEKSEKVPMETLVNGHEKKTLLNSSVDELESDSNTLSELKSLIICDEIKEENSNLAQFEASVNNAADIILLPFVEEKSEKVSMETLVSGLEISCSQEKKTLLNNDEFESDSNTSFELKSLITCDENKEEKACHIFSGGFLPAKLHDSSSEHDHSNLAQFEASVPCIKIGATDGSMVDVEDLNMHAIDLSDKKQVAESCDIAEDKTLFSFPYGSRRSKSYKKIIQDAFMSRKRITKEYKQLAILYGDIEKEFSELTEKNAASNTGTTPKSPARDLCDSEWEIL